MNENYTMSSLNFTFMKPIIECDDGQNITPCVATHPKETCVA